MARLGRCKWTGVSGQRHRYAIYKLPCRFRPGQLGNYIFAKYSRENLWVPVYIGQGDLGACSGPGHPLWQTLMEHGATHFHCHLAPVDDQRSGERMDLLARYLNAYEPYGCNSLQDLTSSTPCETSSRAGQLARSGSVRAGREMATPAR
jgi:hypothetical protein